MRKQRLFCLAFAAGIVTIPSVGRADTLSLPAASYEVGVGFGGPLLSGTMPAQSIYTSGTIAVSANPTNIGTATASISTEPFPSLSVSESVTAPSLLNLNNYVQSAGGDSAMSYYVEFSGPSGSVPILVNAFMSAYATGNTNSSAVFSIGNEQTANYELYDLLRVGVGHGSTGSSSELRGVTTSINYTGVPATLSDSGIWVAQTNTLYQVTLYASADSFSLNGVDSLGNDIPVNGSGSAFVDPTFQIASSVTDPQDYSIRISDGVGNTPASTSAAPEPASSTLLISGLGMIAWMARRRATKG